MPWKFGGHLAGTEQLNLDTLLLLSRTEDTEVRQHHIWMECLLPRTKSPTLKRFISALDITCLSILLHFFLEIKDIGYIGHISSLPRRPSQWTHFKVRPSLIPVNLLILIWHSDLRFKNYKWYWIYPPFPSSTFFCLYLWVCVIRMKPITNTLFSMNWCVKHIQIQRRNMTDKFASNSHRHLGETRGVH